MAAADLLAPTSPSPAGPLVLGRPVPAGVPSSGKTTPGFPPKTLALPGAPSSLPFVPLVPRPLVCLSVPLCLSLSGWTAPCLDFGAQAPGAACLQGPSPLRVRSPSLRALSLLPLPEARGMTGLGLSPHLGPCPPPSGSLCSPPSPVCLAPPGPRAPTLAPAATQPRGGEGQRAGSAQPDVGL